MWLRISRQKMRVWTAGRSLRMVRLRRCAISVLSWSLRNGTDEDASLEAADVEWVLTPRISFEGNRRNNALCNAATAPGMSLSLRGSRMSAFSRRMRRLNENPGSRERSSWPVRADDGATGSARSVSAAGHFRCGRDWSPHRQVRR